MGGQVALRERRRGRAGRVGELVGEVGELVQGGTAERLELPGWVL